MQVALPGCFLSHQHCYIMTINVDDFLAMTLQLLVSGMVFSASVDGGGPVHECSDFVVQIVDVIIRSTEPSKALPCFSTSSTSKSSPIIICF